MVATRAERRSAVEAGLRIQRLEYFTLPVRDLEVARRFYCDVVGGTELEDTGRPETLKIKLFESDVLLYLVEQYAGQPRTDDTNRTSPSKSRSPARSRRSRTGCTRTQFQSWGR